MTAATAWARRSLQTGLGSTGAPGTRSRMPGPLWAAQEIKDLGYYTALLGIRPCGQATFS
jgi:hypothetical protein